MGGEVEEENGTGGVAPRFLGSSRVKWRIKTEELPIAIRYLDGSHRRGELVYL